MQVINPATGERLRTIDGHGPAEVAARLGRAERAFATWRSTPIATRAAGLRRVAERLRAGREIHARLMAEEMGKPVTAGLAEVDKCAWVAEFYAEHAAAWLAPRAVPTDASRSYLRAEPLGPVLAVMPWNFPYWQVLRFAAPALMAGNVGLLKHASSVPGSALAIERLFLDAGLPEGVFQALLVGPDAVPALVADPVVRAVTLTGSDAAGREVAAQAGAALKKVVLELGGSDPFIVLADADPVATARAAARARSINSGQSCIAAKRFLVEEPVAEAFEQALCQEMAGLRVGDPLDPATEVGPLARADLVAALDDQVGRSRARGAQLLIGGQRVDRPGFFYAPTVLGRVEPGMAVFDEETFGPVAPVTRFRGLEQAIDLANRTAFGLGASIWTADSARGESVAERIEAGSVFVNGIVKSDPRLPFGGVKCSGYGRELGEEGLREFLNLKTVWVA